MALESNLPGVHLISTNFTTKSVFDQLTSRAAAKNIGILELGRFESISSDGQPATR